VTEFLRAIKPLLPLIPIGAIAVVLAIAGLAWFRTRRGADRRRAFRTAALDVLAGASILGILLLTLPPSIGGGRTLELVPFGRGWRHSVTNAEMAANVLMFVPLGVFAPARRPALDGWVKAVAAGAAFSLAIECLQFLLGLGRQASTTDVLLNTAGVGLGYLLLRVARPLLRRLPTATAPGRVDSNAPERRRNR
jgi:VanZ like family